MQTCSKPSRPSASFWWCQAAGWGAYFAVNVFTSQSYAPLTSRLVTVHALLSTYGILLTTGFRSFVLQRRWIELPVGKLIPRVVLADLLLAVLLVAAVFACFVVVRPPGPGFPMRGSTAQFAMLTLFVGNSFIIMAVWSGIYFGVAYLKQQRRFEIERYQARTALAEAELRGLKSQLNPHFLFNSLNSLRALVTEDPQRAQQAITELAGILRYQLQSGERSLVPFADELGMVEQYLAIELVRFDDRLTVEREIDPAAMSLLIPPLALQTLVENAVKYGVSREVARSRIRLEARLISETLELTVGNTGTLQTRDSSSTGVGLTNLRTRLRLLFAENASVELREELPGWVEARLVIPARTA